MNREVTFLDGRAVPQGTSVYALCDADGEPRYVGKTSGFTINRFNAHRREALLGRKNLPIHRWLRNRLAADSRIIIRILEWVPGDLRAGSERERFWISEFKSSGRLLNLTDGGEGHLGYVWPRDVLERRAAKARTGSFFDCQQCGHGFWRKRNQIAKGQCKFCSKGCYQASQRGVSKKVPEATTIAGLAAIAAKRRERSHG